MRTATDRRSSLFFFLSAVPIVLACTLIARSQLFARNPDIAAWGITFDLTISIPLLYWLMVVRAGKARPLTIAPVFMLGTIAAALLVPRPQQQFLHQLKLVVGPAAEVALIAAVIGRVRRMRREQVASGDAHARINAATSALFGEGRVAEAVAAEIAMFHYALFSWRKQPAPVEGHAFTVHQRSGWGTILACILVLIVSESIGMHLLIAQASPGGAWLWTAFDVWAIIWLFGDYHALRLRRSSIDDEAFHLRYGMRWSVSVPLASIVSVEAITNEEQWKRRDILKVAILEEPRWLIAFEQPVIARGLAGFRKEIRGIALLP
ncbi:MAG: hypothetical protein M3Q69_08495, partial [Acidobacteriota bacterium]|nr:hypothetical protein [Acidobacteriota bacterium]